MTTKRQLTFAQLRDVLDEVHWRWWSSSISDSDQFAEDALKLLAMSPREYALAVGTFGAMTKYLGDELRWPEIIDRVPTQQKLLVAEGMHCASDLVQRARLRDAYWIRRDLMMVAYRTLVRSYDSDYCCWRLSVLTCEQDRRKSRVLHALFLRMPLETILKYARIDEIPDIIELRARLEAKKLDDDASAAVHSS